MFYLYIIIKTYTKMKTKWLVEEDVLSVAADLKMLIPDELVQTVLESYDDYRTQYPQDNWREIVETMLYDLTGPTLKYTP